jgi:hypothetical protein
MSKITMRAKMQVNKVERFPGQDRITCNAVARSGAYPEDFGRRQQLREVFTAGRAVADDRQPGAARRDRARTEVLSRLHAG